MGRRSVSVGVGLLIPASISCTTPPAEPTRGSSAAVPTARVAAEAARGATVIAAPSTGRVAPRSFPHDVTSFTEGLLYDRGVLFESTGLYGESRLLKLDPDTGNILAQVRLPAEFFGEGLALFRGELFQLTYKEGRCFVYDAATLEKKRELRYQGEGWGLTTDGTRFVMSDGSATLYFRDAASFDVVRRLPVVGPTGPVTELNELEWVDGFILANVWGADVILRIDPATGRVVDTIDLAYLPEPRRRATSDDVLNGIAYDVAGKRLLVTGKRWSRVFELPRPW